MKLPDIPKRLWLPTFDTRYYPTLTHDEETDIAIVGGGIAGLMAGYLLSQKNKKIVILERNRIGYVVTGHTTAHVTCAHELIYQYLTKSIGKEGAYLYGDAQQKGLELIKNIINREKIIADLADMDEYVFAENERDRGKLIEEFEISRLLKLPVTWMDAAPLPFATTGAVRYFGQARIHPYQFIKGLASSIIKNRGKIYEHTTVVKVDDNDQMEVATYKGRVLAKQVIIASHFPIYDTAHIFAKMTPYRSYVVGVTLKEPIKDAMFDSTEDPSHYIRTQEVEGEIIYIIGGEDHITGHVQDTMSCYKDLLLYTQNHFQVESVEYAWSTQDNYPFDRLPIVGVMNKKNPRVLVTTGYQGWGMTNSAASAQLLTDIILGKSNPLRELLDPQREVPVKSPLTAVKDGIQSAAKAIKGKLAGNQKQKGSPAQIVDRDGKQQALYKDKNGVIHKISASCSHLGCTLQFNNAENSWDCPCHGSRFTTDGEVIHGPAIKDLQNSD